MWHWKFGVALLTLGCSTSIKQSELDERVLDADSDGIPSEQDCDDDDSTMLSMLDDVDCDGVVNEEDCAPGNSAISPNADEVWYDGIDQNCDGLNDYDQDGDGEHSDQYDGTDCNDLDPRINGSAEDEWYDGIDTNCDGASDYDQDGDGFDMGGGDCDDLDPSRHPDAVESCDGIDHNCNGNGFEPGTVGITVEGGDQYIPIEMPLSESGQEDFDLTENAPFDNPVWHFCEGTYYQQFTSSDDLSIVGYGDVIWDGQQQHPVLTIENGVEIEIENITIQNGMNAELLVESLNGELKYGAGGIVCDPESHITSLTLKYVRLDNNIGTLGGGLYASTDCELFIEDGDFSGNHALLSGGGIYSLAPQNWMIASTFEGNTAEGRGGAMFIEGESIYSIDHSPFSNPYTLVEEHHNYASTNVLAFIEMSLINNNSAFYGGAIDVKNGKVHLENSELLSNSAAYGGVVYQRGSQVSFHDSIVKYNSSTTGSVVRMYYSGENTTNTLSCSSDSGSIFSNNVSDDYSTAAIHITGPNAIFRSQDCIFIDNENQTRYPDIYLEQGGPQIVDLVSSSTYTEVEEISQEFCSKVGADINQDGLKDWNDHSCSVVQGHHYSSKNMVQDLFVPEPSCITSGKTYQSADAVTFLGEADWSGCMTSSVVSSSDSMPNYAISMFDGEHTLLECEELDSDQQTDGIIGQTVIKGDEVWMGMSFLENALGTVKLGSNVSYGHDCDGNCCYDVYMYDSGGDGWNGASLEVHESGTAEHTLTLSEGENGWSHFCIDDGQSFSLVWNEQQQMINHSETVTVIQGGSPSNTVCHIFDPVSGSQTSCGTAGIMTCN